MLVQSIMIRDLMPLTIDSTTRQAEIQVFDLNIFHVPVTNEGKLLGVLSFDTLTEEDIQNDIALGRFIEDFKQISIPNTSFVFDVLKVFVETGFSALPVIDENSNLLGVLRTMDVVNYLSRTLSINNPGAFITLQLGQNDYNLQEISRIVESNNARILSLHFEPVSEEGVLICTLKINQRDLSHILATFDRFNYKYLAHSSVSEHDDGLQERYNLLMKYLNI
ncbi:CBS domain-containing protein [bacterium]|nr:CBS domain-containing protein [bacterium]